MGQLSQATQQNASASEELAATSEELSGQAEQLQQSIAFFNTGEREALVLRRSPQSQLGPRPGALFSKAPALRALSTEFATTAATRFDTSGVDLDKVIAAHGQWKTKFRAAISRQETLDAKLIGRDDCCELGKWLYGPTRARYGSHPRFVELLREHKNFHYEAGIVATAINEKKFSNASKLIDHGSAFADASTAVTSSISALKRS
jgi:hypothetical protein